jgi:hypothetical protein
MGLTSGAVLASAVVLAVLLPLSVLVGWNRLGAHPLVRWPARIALLGLCQLSACLVVALGANDYGRFYASWSDLFGRHNGVSTAAGRPLRTRSALRDALAIGYRTQHSILTSLPVPVAGPGSRLTSAIVYLPAAYFQQRYTQARFPVLELLDGVPSSTGTWTGPLNLQKLADREIDAGRSLPFVAVMPDQNYLLPHDGECVNAAHGPQLETMLTTNVQRTVETYLRVQGGRSGWAVGGFSTGGYCASNIVLRHPNAYSLGVSLSGYDEPYLDDTTGDLFGGSLRLRRLNTPSWLARHGPHPPVSLLLMASAGDRTPVRDDARLAAAIRRPTRAYLLTLPEGGHNFAVFQEMEPVMFDWLSQRWSASLAPGVIVGGQSPRLAGSPVG